MNTDTEDKKAQLIKHRREQILTAASHIFAQNGFRRTRIEEIAYYLTVGKGTLYKYFKDKKSLFLAVFEQGVSHLRQAISTNVEPITDPQRKIAAAVRTYFEFFDNNRELVEIMMQVRSEFKDDYRRIFLATYGDYIVKIQENLRNGIKSGVFRQLDVEKTAEAMSATLQGLLQSFYVRQFGPETETLSVDAEKPTPANSGYLKGNQAERQPGWQRELLTDRIDAVTELFLEGCLLKKNDD
jgi:AcrR family transcriptional regulator